jgi:hypothetical protein
MSRLVEELQLAAPLDVAKQACRDGAAEAKMKVKQESEHTMRVTHGISLLRNPTDYQLEFTERDGATDLKIEAHILGIGPIVEQTLKRDLASLRSAIELQVPVQSWGSSTSTD